VRIVFDHKRFFAPPKGEAGGYGGSGGNTNRLFKLDLAQAQGSVPDITNYRTENPPKVIYSSFNAQLTNVGHTSLNTQLDGFSPASGVAPATMEVKFRESDDGTTWDDIAGTDNTIVPFGSVNFDFTTQKRYIELYWVSGNSSVDVFLAHDTETDIAGGYSKDSVG